MKAINLPLRATPKNTPYVDWTMPDWEDNGWNKAMREVAHRLNDAGIPVVILEENEPNPAGQSAGEARSTAPALLGADVQPERKP